MGGTSPLQPPPCLSLPPIIPIVTGRPTNAVIMWLKALPLMNANVPEFLTHSQCACACCGGCLSCCRLFGAAQLATPTGWRPSTPSGSFRDSLFKQLEDAAANCKPSLTEQVRHLLCLKTLRHLLCLKTLRHLLCFKNLRHLLGQLQTLPH